MKTIKTILIAATLICASVASMSAQQEAQPAQTHEFKVAIGDSVMIKRECQKYCTGETPSTWVWDKVHTVRQLGTKRFADGVLLMNIYSWMCEECLIPVNGRSSEAAKQAAEEQKEEKEAWEQAKKANEEAAAAEEQAAREAAEKEAREAAEKAAAEEAAAQQAAEEAAEQAKTDSIKSEQKFKHHYDRFTIGVRGGVASQLHNSVKGVDAKWSIGADAILDLQYAHYWTKDGRPVDLGLIVGLGVGYAQGGFGGSEDSTFMKDVMRYTINAKIKETDRQIQLEIPLLFSLIHENGFFFNVGPRFMVPVYTPYSQSVKKTENDLIVAYDTENRVTLQDPSGDGLGHIVTGRYNGEKPDEKNGLQFKINIMLTAELGYEWILKSGNSLGLGAYADYSVYNSYSHAATASSESLLNLTPPSNGGIASLNVLSATNTYAKKIGYFDVGVKLAYHFNFPKKRQFKDKKLF